MGWLESDLLEASGEISGGIDRDGDRGGGVLHGASGWRMVEGVDVGFDVGFVVVSMPGDSPPVPRYVGS